MGNLLTVVVKVDAGHLEVSVVDLQDGILLNQYSIKQKKSIYNALLNSSSDQVLNFDNVLKKIINE